MGKTARKHRKNRSYEPVSSTDKASPYDIHDGKGARHVEDDLLSSPREFVPLDKLAPGHSSSLRLVLTMITTSVGAMAAALPFAVLQGGFVMTIFIVLFVSLISHVTRTRLIELGIEQGIYSFQGLAKLAFGPVGGFAVGVTQIGTSLGLTIAYLVIIFQDIPIVLGRWFKMDFDSAGRPIVTPGTRVSPLLALLADRHWFAEAVTLLVVIPYCLYSNSYARMRLSPAIVCAAAAAAAFGAVVKAKGEHENIITSASQGYNRDYLHVPSTVCQSFAIVTMTMASQHHSFHTFYAMHDRCPRWFRRLSLVATLGSLGVGLCVGIGGYVSFVGATKEDVLHNYNFANNRLGLLLWTVLPFSAVTCVSYELIVSRHTVQFLCRPRTHVKEEKQDVLFASQNTESTAVSDHLHYEEHESPWTSNLLVAMALAVLAQVPIFIVSDIATVLSLSGGLAGITLCFILPAACQLKLSTPSSWCADHFVPCLSIAIGFVGALAAIISSVVHLRHTAGSSGTTS